MKLNYILTPMLVGLGLVAMTSCSDDNDSNPTLHMPESNSFTLNTPATAASVLDLEATTDSVVLTWSQPDYGGFPLPTTYYVQYALDDAFSTAEDDEGNIVQNYVQEDEPLPSCKAAVAVSDINRNLMNLLGVASADDVPSVTEVYFRITAQTASTSVIYSNPVKILVAPYFQALVAADPIIWYLTGSCIGDGSWTSGVPNGCMPMYFSQENTYNDLDGTGEIVWIGYLTPDGFKFRGDPNDGWAVQIGQGDSFGEYKLNDGGSGNISVPVAGYYKVVLDTKLSTPTITAYDADVHEFDGIALSGSFNDWGDTEMEPIATYAGAKNHDWHLNIDLTAGAEVKFKEVGSWSFNWGGSLTSLSYGYYGNGATNGANLYIDEDGNYDIYFNDITGTYRFVRN